MNYYFWKKRNFNLEIYCINVITAFSQKVEKSDGVAIFIGADWTVTSIEILRFPK